MYISFDRKRVAAPASASPVSRVSSTVVILGVVSLLTDVSSESVASILPLYITGALGLSTIAFGFIDGLYQGVSAIVRIGGGWASDRSDQPKWIAVFGYGVSALAKVWLLIASGFAAVVGVITVDRLGKGVRTAPRDALITAASDDSNLARSFGVHRTLDTIGAAAGPLLAFVILSVLPTGYEVVFVVSLCFAVLGVVLLALLVPARHPRAERVSRGEPRAPFRWRNLAEPRLRRLMLAAGMLAVLTVGDGFIYLVLQDRSSFAAQWFPLLYVGTNVAFFLFAMPLGRLADRLGRARVFVVGHVALLGAYAFAALPVGGIVITVACLLLLGAFYAATDGVLAALAGEFAPAGNTASGIAAAQTVVAVGRLIGATSFGFLWFAAGREAAVIIVAIALAIAIPLMLVLVGPLVTAKATT
ncbi:MAG: major facilitator transporter [Microbacteriaceae bacterium]|nr:major facilitator transporter [Microbacteriaceae bacterium]